MCMNCGCNQPDDRHGNPDNITREDLERAGRANGQSLDETVGNIQRTREAMRLQGSGGSQHTGIAR
jgi:hypothetical protein